MKSPLSCLHGEICFNSKILLLCSATDAQNTDEVSPATARASIVCKVNANKPAYHPNIYECQSVEKCCVNEGAPSCCGTDIKSSAMFIFFPITLVVFYRFCCSVEQAIMWGCLIGILLVVGIFAYCYFNDTYCCDPEPDEDGGTYCCCIPASSSRYKKRVNVDEYVRRSRCPVL